MNTVLVIGGVQWKDSMIDSEEEEGEATNGRRRKTAVSNDAQFVLTNILPAEQRLHLTLYRSFGSINSCLM